MGIQTLEERYKKKMKEVRKGLFRTCTVHLTQTVRQSFPRRRVLVKVIDDQWQIDMVDLSILYRVNDDNNFSRVCDSVCLAMTRIPIMK